MRFKHSWSRMHERGRGCGRDVRRRDSKIAHSRPHVFQHRQTTDNASAEFAISSNHENSINRCSSSDYKGPGADDASSIRDAINWLAASADASLATGARVSVCADGMLAPRRRARTQLAVPRLRLRARPRRTERRDRELRARRLGARPRGGELEGVRRSRCIRIRVSRMGARAYGNVYRHARTRVRRGRCQHERRVRRIELGDARRERPQLVA